MRPGIKTVIGLMLAVAVLAIACSEEPVEVTVNLEEQEGSGQTGTVTLTQKGGNQTEVTVNVTPSRPSDEPQPVHAHFGICGPNLGAVDKPLTDIVDGKSETLVPLSLSDLKDGDHSVNVHKSYSEISAYTACATIPPD